MCVCSCCVVIFIFIALLFQIYCSETTQDVTDVSLIGSVTTYVICDICLNHYYFFGTEEYFFSTVVELFKPLFSRSIRSLSSSRI